MTPSSQNLRHCAAPTEAPTAAPTASTLLLWSAPSTMWLLSRMTGHPDLPLSWSLGRRHVIVCHASSTQYLEPSQNQLDSQNTTPHGSQMDPLRPVRQKVHLWQSPGHTIGSYCLHHLLFPSAPCKQISLVL